MRSDRIRLLPLRAKVVRHQMAVGDRTGAIDIVTIPVDPPAEVSIPIQLSSKLSFFEGSVKGWSHRRYTPKVLYWIALSVPGAGDEKNFGFKEARLEDLEDVLLDRLVLPSRPAVERLGGWIRGQFSGEAIAYRAEWVDHRSGAYGLYFVVQDLV